MKFNYKNYLQEIVKPKTKMDIFNRFLFSFCSVHTTWQNNMKGYLVLKDTIFNNENKIPELLSKSSLGLITTRTKALTKFTKRFKENHKQFLKKRNETWQEYATRLEKTTYGLGFAKTRFAIELLYPNSAKVCCVDTHVIQLHKQNPKKMNKTLYKKIEQGHLQRARLKKKSPVELRWEFWDKKQGYKDCRYWTKVFE
jgi:endonuclease III